MPQITSETVRADFNDIAAVLSFVRGGWGNHAAAVTPGQVKDLRRTTDPSSDQVTILKMR